MLFSMRMTRSRSSLQHETSRVLCDKFCCLSQVDRQLLAVLNFLDESEAASCSATFTATGRVLFRCKEEECSVLRGSEMRECSRSNQHLFLEEKQKNTKL